MLSSVYNPSCELSPRRFCILHPEVIFGYYNGVTRSVTHIVINIYTLQDEIFITVFALNGIPEFRLSLISCKVSAPLMKQGLM